MNVAHQTNCVKILRMLKIRLQRVGRKHDPSYRIVATNSRTGPKSNKHVAILGQYDSIRKTTNIIDAEQIKDMISKGAQVSPRVHNILVTEGVLEGKKVNVLPKKTPIIKEPTEEELAAQAEAEAKANAPAEESKEEEAAEESTEAPAEEESTPEAEEAPATEEKTEE